MIIIINKFAAFLLHSDRSLRFVHNKKPFLAGMIHLRWKGYVHLFTLVCCGLVFDFRNNVVTERQATLLQLIRRQNMERLTLTRHWHQSA